VFDRFAARGLEVVYVGALETPESCAKWGEEFELPFPVVADEDGELFRQLTNGWVPCNILVAPDGTVLFAEDNFDEEGYATAIATIYETEREPVDTAAAGTPAPRVGALGAARVVVLGGGVGGLVAAHRLRERLPKQHEVVLIDRSPDHLFQSSLLWLMIGDRNEEQICRPLWGLGRRGIGFRQAEVEEIDVARKIVRTTSDAFEYDYLVISLGARLAPETVPGFEEMALDLYDVEGCQRIHAALESFASGSIGVLIPSMPFKCPAAPYEAALLVEAHLRRRGVRERSEIHLFTPEHQPMPQAGSDMGAAIAEILRARGIQYHPLFTFQELRPRTNEICSSDGRSERIDLLLGVPPHQAPEVVRAAGLLGPSGWIHVDPETLATAHEGVFAIGDITTIKLRDGKNLPKAGVFAHNQAEVVAERIASEINGGTARSTFDGKGSCWLEVGEGKAGFARGRFFADPSPKVRMYHPSRMWHWGKVAFEKWWLRKWFR